MEEAGMDSPGESENLNMLKHDIKNQLSNMVLALSQLAYELNDINSDQQFYLDIINDSCKKINTLVDEM